MTAIDPITFEFTLDCIGDDVVTDARHQLRVTAKFADRHRGRGSGATADDRETRCAMLFGTLRDLRGAEDEVLHRVADAQRPLHVKVTS